MNSDLKENGWAVVADVLTKEEVKEAVRLFVDWKAATIKKEEWFSAMHGIIKHYGVGHSAMMWYVRSLPAVQAVFQEAWASEGKKMVSSFDGMCVIRPPEGSRRAVFNPDNIWLHVDQTPNTSANAKLPYTSWGAKCIQGAVNLTKSDEDDGCFYLLDGSHKFHEEFFRVHDLGKATGDFFMMTKEHIAWYEAKGCRRKAVAVSRGSMTLWDSRLVHCGKLPDRGRQHPNRWRLVAFVSMVPRAFCNATVRAKRKRNAQDNRTTSHWPHTPRVNSKKPRESHLRGMPYREVENHVDVDRDLV